VKDENPIQLDAAWPGLIAGPTATVDVEVLRSFADKLDGALKALDGNTPGSPAYLAQHVQLREELAPYCPTATAVMNETGHIIVHYALRSYTKPPTTPSLTSTDISLDSASPTFLASSILGKMWVRRIGVELG
jgi:hypothetical protein